ncbi:MAG: S9 family peptidase [Bdellovibrionales bacterium]|nr:S9 family peptidase [Bdellovibrionales bacterium]
MKLSIFVSCVLFVTSQLTHASSELLKSNTNLLSESTSSLDKHLLYLEEIHGVTAYQWVEEQNKKSIDQFTADPRFNEVKQQLLDIYTSPDKLEVPEVRGDYAYNLWTDKVNPKGILRRMLWEDYKKGLRNWEILLDVDKLAQVEGVDWVYEGRSQYKDRVIIYLSKGGSDAVTAREYDFSTKTFIENGYFLEEAVGNQIHWLDENNVYVISSNEGGKSTKSKYPGTLRKWKRGEPLSLSKSILEVDDNHISVDIEIIREKTDGKILHTIVSNWESFYGAKRYYKLGDQLIPLNIPVDASASFTKDDIYLELEKNWEPNGNFFKSGSLVRASVNELIVGQLNFQLVFDPKYNEILNSSYVFEDRVILVVSQHVQQGIIELTLDPLSSNKYLQRTILEPQMAKVSISYKNTDKKEFLYWVNKFLAPSRAFLYDLKTQKSQVFLEGKEHFDASLFEARQYFVTSKDGTRVPFFVVHKKGISYNPLAGHHPVLIKAYGGFKVAQRPRYIPDIAKAWLERDGIYVLANIRGGNEYGPEWWEAAILENKQKSYDDLIAVSGELIHMGLTRPKKIAVQGGSNGGLLTGNMLVQRPDLFGAVVINVPLLDMLRFHKLLRGASWQDEFGFPDDPKDAEHLLKISPFHNLKPNVNYPTPLIMTATGDDRVHPGHARKFAAKMEVFNQPFYFYEDTSKGGHGSADILQYAYNSALIWTYLMQNIMDN